MLEDEWYEELRVDSANKRGVVVTVVVVLVRLVERDVSDKPNSSNCLRIKRPLGPMFSSLVDLLLGTDHISSSSSSSTPNASKLGTSHWRPDATAASRLHFRAWARCNEPSIRVSSFSLKYWNKRNTSSIMKNPTF